ncbi:hypothetical protein SCA6_001773 [Theobroma cacao]
MMRLYLLFGLSLALLISALSSSQHCMYICRGSPGNSQHQKQLSIRYLTRNPYWRWWSSITKHWIRVCP